jgi:CRP/FNR family transcriptional regulator, cyclic AMP receptor protein
MNLILHFVNARNTRIIAPGTALFREGDPGLAMYVLLEGAARIVVGEHVVEVAGPGALLGEMALIDDRPRSATVLAASACRVIEIGRAEFDLLVREKPEFARHVMKVIVERLRRMNDVFADIKAAQRTAASLMRKPPPRRWRVPHVDDTVPT